MTDRTSMNCVRCGGFSSTRVCWHCSNLPDAIQYAETERLREENLDLRSKLALAAEDAAGMEEMERESLDVAMKATIIAQIMLQTPLAADEKLRHAAVDTRNAANAFLSRWQRPVSDISPEVSNEYCPTSLPRY